MKEFHAAAGFAKKALKSGIMQFRNRLPELQGVVYEVTDQCNSRCRHCNIWETKPTENLLTIDEVKKTFSDSLFRNLETLIITGGEPVLREDLKDLILAINSILPNTRITLSTNGLLPERVIDAVNVLTEKGVCMDVGVSLDGIGKMHDRIRGVKGNFESVAHLLKELQKLKRNSSNKFNISIGHTLSGLTFNTLPETVSYARELNLPIFTQLCEEFSYYSNHNRRVNADKTELIKAVKQLPLSIHNEKLLKVLETGKPVKFKCFSMKSFFLLKCDGSVAPCLRYSDHRVLNVRDFSPTEIWQSIEADKARETVSRCEGCSNTWATGWSLDNWFLPFINIMIRYRIKRQFSHIATNSTR